MVTASMYISTLELASMYISTLEIVMEQYHGTYFYKEKMLYNDMIKKQTYYDYTLTLI